MKKMGLFVLVLMILSLGAAFLVSAPTPASAVPTAEDNTIIIETTSSGTLYKQTEYNLQKGVTYTIVFRNTQSIPHNVVIADRKVETDADAVIKSGDVVIGPRDDDPNPEVQSEWNVTWTAPNEDKVVPFFCSFTGHFAGGMRGVFIIGSPTDDQFPSWAKPGNGPVPGFEIIMILSALALAGTVMVLKKRSL